MICHQPAVQLNAIPVPSMKDGWPSTQYIYMSSKWSAEIDVDVDVAADAAALKV